MYICDKHTDSYFQIYRDTYISSRTNILIEYLVKTAAFLEIGRKQHNFTEFKLHL